MFSPSPLHRRYAPNVALVPNIITGFGDYCIVPTGETEERVFLAATAMTCVTFGSCRVAQLGVSAHDLNFPLQLHSSL